ncbi:hypothetical protein MJO28_011041 [Puccinia striiformis f. sp. tritici]|uniref:Uncharacterized protein n=1 Tax=Puccinia striiformis f. sp. tritici TaxID=168172 RepID=A0ACC0E137_9BASI|nr:hypothetical protein MJO28_011041 [Puccinia striiformis f. sp. tritici]
MHFKLKSLERTMMSYDKIQNTNPEDVNMDGHHLTPWGHRWRMQHARPAQYAELRLNFGPALILTIGSNISEPEPRIYTRCVWPSRNFAVRINRKYK